MSLRIVKLVFCSNKKRPRGAARWRTDLLYLSVCVCVCVYFCSLYFFLFGLCMLLSVSIIYLSLFFLLSLWIYFCFHFAFIAIVLWKIIRLSINREMFSCLQFSWLATVRRSLFFPCLLYSVYVCLYLFCVGNESASFCNVLELTLFRLWTVIVWNSSSLNTQNGVTIVPYLCSLQPSTIMVRYIYSVNEHNTLLNRNNCHCIISINYILDSLQIITSNKFVRVWNRILYTFMQSVGNFGAFIPSPIST